MNLIFSFFFVLTKVEISIYFPILFFLAYEVSFF